MASVAFSSGQAVRVTNEGVPGVFAALFVTGSLLAIPQAILGPPSAVPLVLAGTFGVLTVVWICAALAWPAARPVEGLVLRWLEPEAP
jgi:hypothetical protein